MTIEPISDERLAEIRAGLEGVTVEAAAEAAYAAFHANVRREHSYLPPAQQLADEKPYLRECYAEMVCAAAAVFLPALLSRLDKAEAGWRPIETAPKDGRMALVYRPLARNSGDEPVALKRLIGGNKYCWPATVPEGDKPFNPTDGSCHVTHWRPLPPPPSES